MVESDSADVRHLLPDGNERPVEDPRDHLKIAAELVETLVPRWADHAAVHLLDEVHLRAARPEPGQARSTSSHTVLHRVAIAHGPLSAPSGTFLPAGEVLRVPARSPISSTLAGGETLHFPHIDSFTADHLTAQLGDQWRVAQLRDRSILLLPFGVAGSALGNVMVVREPGRLTFGDQEITAIEAITRWAALGFDINGSYARETRLVDQLGHGLRPGKSPKLPELELNYRYLPENRNIRIGGDWYDVIPLTDGRITLVIGDVMGHGVSAAIVMNRCRAIIRTLATLGMPPDQMLERFDRHFAELTCLPDDDHMATCLIVIYDPTTGRCEAANAGQIPPVLVHPDGRGEVLDIPTGAPIGTAGAGFRTSAFPTAHGSLLALCTDGFTTLHDADIDQALARLRATLTDPGRPLAELCDDAFHGTHAETRRDDVTLVLARLVGRHRTPH